MQIQKYSLVLALIFCSLLACQTTEELEKPQQTYQVSQIEWQYIAQDEDNILEKAVPEQVFQNPGDNPLTIEVNPLEGLMGTSLFEFDQPDHFALANLEEALVESPSYQGILGGFIALDNGQEVLLGKEAFEFPLTVEMGDAFELPAKTAMNYQGTAEFKNLKANFLLTVTEYPSQQTHQLSGVWTGTFFYGFHSDVVVNELE
ncbi:MAG: hypothetical protein JJU34_12830 [Lunatimonas sp.]|uniref:hypothetical protein n=1 Tax=Lunatimonas sp. TaxID=2060141 RepID=UPI00263A6321|nr:hypothetical protein [Lunatimonas sp.]MCC5938156.1 hypothetical protein [Lunatimonas sp.]